MEYFSNDEITVNTNEKSSETIQNSMENEISIQNKINSCFSKNLPFQLLELNIHDVDALNAIKDNLTKISSLNYSDLSTFLFVLLLSCQNWLNDFLLNKINLPSFIKETRENIHNLQQQITEINEKINNLGKETKEMNQKQEQQINEINQNIINHESKERVGNIEKQLQQQINELKQNITNYQSTNNKINEKNNSNISSMQNQINDITNALKDYEQKISKIRSSFVAFDINPGKEICKNNDLNSFREIGNYFCHLDLVAPSIKNLPGKARAFRLVVGSACGSDYELFQELTYYNNGAKYYRMASKATKYSWGSWNQISINK